MNETYAVSMSGRFHLQRPGGCRTLCGRLIGKTWIRTARVHDGIPKSSYFCKQCTEMEADGKRGCVVYGDCDRPLTERAIIEAVAEGNQAVKDDVTCATVAYLRRAAHDHRPIVLQPYQAECLVESIDMADRALEEMCDGCSLRV